MTVREAMDVIGITIEGNVVSFKSHVKFDVCGQRITDLVLLEGILVVPVSFMAMLTQSDWTTLDQQGIFSLWSGNAL